MGVKRGNLKLISGLLLPSFILNYMLIRVKERGSHRRVSVGASRGPDLGRDKLGIRALGSLVSSHKNRSSRVLRNGRGTPLLFLERL